MSDPVQPLTIGTAGHVDHGKTALVRALTGIDTDRLPEERARGLSIALGYAPLSLPSGRRLSVVDVPGHERFVRTMVAGATGIDCFLMTVAADDGVMPQTREHAVVLRGLAIASGVVAITKCDLADPGATREQLDELLPAVPAIAVSARTGTGLDELFATLERMARDCAARSDRAGPVRLHVDRVFTVRGAGTVVTGSLWSGTIGRGDQLRLLPSGRAVRVRAVQVHDEAIERAVSGQRVAVNLAGIKRDAVARGDVLTCRDGELAPSHVVDVALDVPVPRGRFQVHHGTRETPARIVPLGGGRHRLRLERPLIPLRGDRVIMRSIAPADTIGGGAVLDPLPRGRAASDEGPPPRTLPAAPSLTEAALEAERRLRAAGHEPPPDAAFDTAALTALRRAGRATRLGPTLHVHPEMLADVEQRLRAIVSADGNITLARLRDELATSRRYALALLEHFDRERVTVRHADDTRTLRRRA